MYLDKNCAKEGANNQEKQNISDVFLLKNHSDPQLRGAISILASNFIKSALLVSEGNFDLWIKKNCLTDTSQHFDISFFLDFIIQVTIIIIDKTILASFIFLGFR